MDDPNLRHTHEGEGEGSGGKFVLKLHTWKTNVALWVEIENGWTCNGMDEAEDCLGEEGSEWGVVGFVTQILPRETNIKNK